MFKRNHWYVFMGPGQQGKKVEYRNHEGWYDDVRIFDFTYCRLRQTNDPLEKFVLQKGRQELKRERQDLPEETAHVVGDQNFGSVNRMQTFLSLSPEQLAPGDRDIETLWNEGRMNELGFGEYDQRSDWWGFGTIVLNLCCGEQAFLDYEAPFWEMLNFLMDGEYGAELESVTGVSENLQDLLAGLFQVDPAERLTYEQIIMHPWFMEDLSDVTGDKRFDYVERPPFGW